ncbi:MAG: hypothetical protein GXO66_02140 [Euryarchaeota archaeon]|nr:hypothetical protein [Euryarchaeota archaeon]
MEYLEIVLETRESGGTSRLRLEGLEYEEARERVREHLGYIFRTERFVGIKIAARGEEREVEREFRKLSHRVALEKVMDFLSYVYGVEETGAEEFAPARESWLSGYDIERMTQKEKLLLLLKHNHPGEWVRSQDIQEEYEILFGERIKLSSLSTYLARFYESGLLERRGSRAQWEYRLPEASRLGVQGV